MYLSTYMYQICTICMCYHLKMLKNLLYDFSLDPWFWRVLWAQGMEDFPSHDIREACVGRACVTAWRLLAFPVHIACLALLTSQCDGQHWSTDCLWIRKQAQRPRGMPPSWQWNADFLAPRPMLVLRSGSELGFCLLYLLQSSFPPAWDLEPWDMAVEPNKANVEDVFVLFYFGPSKDMLKDFQNCLYWGLYTVPILAKKSGNFKAMSKKNRNTNVG